MDVATHNHSGVIKTYIYALAFGTKKKPEEMDKQRKIFLEGAGNKNVDAKQAAHIFDLMAKFAGYGFNKSHSTAYAVVAYRTAYLKANYPAEFMAALLSSEMRNSEKLRVFIDEARKMGLEGADWEDIVRDYHDGSVPPNRQYEISIPFGRFNIEFETGVFDTEIGGVTRPIT